MRAGELTCAAAIWPRALPDLAALMQMWSTALATTLGALVDRVRTHVEILVGLAGFSVGVWKWW